MGKEKVIAHLSSSGSKISLTVDYWTSPNQIQFLVVTARWVNPVKTKFISSVLDFKKVDNAHTSQETAAQILLVMEHFGICEKVRLIFVFYLMCNSSVV